MEIEFTPEAQSIKLTPEIIKMKYDISSFDPNTRVSEIIRNAIPGEIERIYDIPLIDIINSAGIEEDNYGRHILSHIDEIDDTPLNKNVGIKLEGNTLISDIVSQKEVAFGKNNLVRSKAFNFCRGDTGWELRFFETLNKKNRKPELITMDCFLIWNEENLLAIENTAKVANRLREKIS